MCFCRHSNNHTKDCGIAELGRVSKKGIRGLGPGPLSPRHSPLFRDVLLGHSPNPQSWYVRRTHRVPDTVPSIFLTSPLWMWGTEGTGLVGGLEVHAAKPRWSCTVELLEA